MRKISVLAKSESPPEIVTISDEHASMINYAFSSSGSKRLEAARQEVADGNCVAADDAYFILLNDRISTRAADIRKSSHTTAIFADRDTAWHF